MVEFKIELDESEIQLVIKEMWYKRIRKEVERSLSHNVVVEVKKWIENNPAEFRNLIKDSVQDILERYKIRDLDHLKRELGLKRIRK